MAREYKKNQVKVDLTSYLHYWRGLKKIGKSTLFRDLLIAKYGTTDAGLAINLGNEDGYNTLDDLNYDVADDWGTFVEIVDDLVENKEENSFKLISIDTVDELVKLATLEVLKIHRRLKGSPAESINAALGGYGAGRAKIKELIDNEITRLKRSGYGIIMIGHTKVKDIKEKTGEEYQQLTSSLNADYDSIFSDKADIIMTISVDKSIANGILSGTKRYMHFRDDGFIDCGSRFKNMPDKVEFSAENYIEAFESGVKSSMNVQISDKELKKIAEKEIKAKENDAKEYIEKAKKPSNEDLVAIIKEKYPLINGEPKNEVQKIMNDYNIESFKNPDSLPNEGLQKIAEILKTI